MKKWEIGRQLNLYSFPKDLSDHEFHFAECLEKRVLAKSANKDDF